MTTPESPPAPVVRLGRAPLVGRAAELARLLDALDEARAGHPSVVGCSGEPGIGKSRLLDEFPPRDHAAGMTVLRGGASESAGLPPYLPWLEALTEYCDAVPVETLRADLGANAAVLATLLPTLPARLGPLTPAYGLSPEQERLRLYEAVAALFGAIAARGPVVVTLDDLHWADSASCDLLIHLARRLRGQGAQVLLIGAYREGEAEENAPLQRALAELNRQRLLLRLPLRPLTPAESTDLIAGLLRGSLAPEVGATLHHRAEGNPFFAEELLQGFLEIGALVQRGGRWELGAITAHPLPPGLLGAIKARLARLDPALIELLHLAAVAGYSCQVETLATAAGLDPEQAEALLLTATRARLVQPTADGDYAFSHQQIREALLTEIGPARRRRYHRAIGEALEAQGAAASPQRLTDLTYHFVAIGDTARGATYALAAGDQALHARAAAEALGHYQAAARLLTAGSDEPRHQQALLGIGEAALLSGDYPQATASFREVARAHERAGNPALAARAWRLTGEALWRQENLDDARAAFEHALAMLHGAEQTETAEILLWLANLHAVSLGQHAAGLAYGEQALALIERLGDPRLTVRACLVVGNVRARNNDLLAGRALLERALALARVQDDPVQAAEACAYLTNVSCWAGDLPRGLEMVTLQATLAPRTGDPYQLRHVFMNEALLRAWRGEWALAERLLGQAEQAIAQLGSPEPRMTLQLHRGVLRYYQARFAESAAALDEAVALTRQIGPDALIWCLGPSALALLEAGHHEEAHARLAELDQLVQRRDERATDRTHALVHLTIGRARLGQPERAAAYYPALLPFQGQSHVILVDRALGVAAACRSDHLAALRHLTAAATQARRSGQRPELALVLLQQGTLAGPPTPATARATLAEGWQLCDALGIRELGHRMLAALPPPVSPEVAPSPPPSSTVEHPPPPSTHEGLSPRQLEVLRLLAQGRTNREIAEALFISEGTVANHVTAILTRLGVENRSAAVAHALRHRLA